jgi:hypothetical protein
MGTSGDKFHPKLPLDHSALKGRNARVSAAGIRPIPLQTVIGKVPTGMAETCTLCRPN